MVHDPSVDDTKYSGPSKTIEILGHGNAYGWIGSISGLFVGGVVSAVSTKEPGKWTTTATEFLKKVNVDLNGKWAMIAGGALAGSQILHYAGFISGLRIGADKAGRGQAQFERIKARCDVLKDQLQEMKAERKQHEEEFHKDQDTPTTEPTTAVNTITREGVGATNAHTIEQLDAAVPGR